MAFTCVCVYIEMHFFLAYTFVTKVYTTSLSKQKAKDSLCANLISHTPIARERFFLSPGDLISEESTLLSRTTLSSAFGPK